MTMERRITRRQALGAAGTAGAALLAARPALAALGDLVAATPAAAANTKAAVAVTPSMTEGPYWIDEMLRRFDVRANTSSASTSAGAAQAGVPLTLKINVLDASSGGAINGAHVDIWHANAYGLYSDEGGQQTGGGTTNGNTTGQNFLRGYQITGVDAGAETAPVDGQVSFKTIWPGWYSGRTIHIHVRVRTYNGSAVATNYTTQIFFSDADNNAVLSGAAPYNTRSPKTDPTTNQTDNVLGQAGSVSGNIVGVSGSLAEGFAAVFNIGLTGVVSNVSSTAKTDTAVAASLRTASVVTAKNGNRTVVLAVHAGEKLTAHASVVRSGKTLGKATGALTPGWHSLRVSLADGVAAGAAVAKVALVDAAGNSKTLSTAVHIPA
jgi:protocatechuate 3,4-dioxygenase beta subunit